MTGFPKLWARIAKLGALPSDVTPHVLRHSFASIAADLGFSATEAVASVLLLGAARSDGALVRQASVAQVTRLARAPADDGGASVRGNGQEGTPPKLGKNERKRQAVDAVIGKLGVDAVANMSGKARQQAITQCAGRELGGLNVSDRYVRERLAAARNKQQERSHS